MSRPFVITALALYALAGFAPIVAMALRVDLSDLETLLDERTLGLLGRTVMLGGGASAIAVLLGAPFGFLVARTNVPGARVLRPVALVALILPPLFVAITWSALTNLRGAPAAIGILGLHTFPIVAFFTATAFLTAAVFLVGFLAGFFVVFFALLVSAFARAIRTSGTW